MGKRHYEVYSVEYVGVKPQTFYVWLRKYIKKQKLSGFLILDYIIFCKSLDSIDRFIGFMVKNGNIIYSDKYIFSDKYVELKVIADRFHSKNIDTILKYSMLSDNEKNKLRKWKGLWFLYALKISIFVEMTESYILKSM